MCCSFYLANLLALSVQLIFILGAILILKVRLVQSEPIFAPIPIFIISVSKWFLLIFLGNFGLPYVFFVDILCIQLCYESRDID